jgi:hypothetical protein
LRGICWAEDEAKIEIRKWKIGREDNAEGAETAEGKRSGEESTQRTQRVEDG